MPIKVNFIDDGKGVEFMSSGIITGKEIIEANKEIYTPQHLPKLRYKIIDRTNCTDYRVTSNEIRIIANQDKEASKINNDITVLLVTQSILQYGMTRMWQMLSENTGFKSEIFDAREKADEYIKKVFPQNEQGKPNIKLKSIG